MNTLRQNKRKTKARRLQIIIEAGRTVFRTQDLSDLWGDTKESGKINVLGMYREGLIFRICPGYYALNEDYNKFELANLILGPSYITGNTALNIAGINFQKRDAIESASLINYKKKVRSDLYLFRSIKRSLFFDTEGINVLRFPAIASPERAILDLFYWNLLPDLDLIDKVNMNNLKKLSLKYPKTVQKKAKRLYGQFI